MIELMISLLKLVQPQLDLLENMLFLLNNPLEIEDDFVNVQDWFVSRSFFGFQIGQKDNQHLLSIFYFFNSVFHFSDSI